MTGLEPGAEMLPYAVRLAESGHPVFPCWPFTYPRGFGRAKAPLVPHGFEDATTDLAQVEKWWDRWPQAAIGLPTGVRWNVLDVDNKPGGVNGFVALRRLRRLLEGREVKTAWTPTRGMHFYFPADPEAPVGNRSYAGAGLDVRGAGGYVVAPPSIIYGVDGRGVVGHYEIIDQWPDDRGAPLPVAEMDEILRPADPVVLDDPRHRERGRAERPASRDYAADEDGGIERLSRWLRGQTQQGERNRSLYWAASRVVEQGADPTELLDAALEIGLDHVEAERTIRSAIRKAGA